MFDQEGFNRFIFENDVMKITEGKVQLSAGGSSHLYIDWKDVFGDAFLLEKLTGYVIDFINEIEFEPRFKPTCFYGIPDGCNSLSVLLNMRLARESLNYGPGSHKVPMGRKTTKKWGLPERRYFAVAPSDKSLIIEDVVTTGKNIKDHLDRIWDSDIRVAGVIGLMDRCHSATDSAGNRYSVKDVLAQFDVSFYSMSNAKDLLPLTVERCNPRTTIVEAIEKEYEDFGFEPIKLR